MGVQDLVGWGFVGGDGESQAYVAAPRPYSLSTMRGVAAFSSTRN